MSASVKQRLRPKRSKWAIVSLCLVGLAVYLFVVGGLVFGVEWFGPIAWQRAFFPFADPGASVMDPAFVAALVVAVTSAIALRRRQGVAGALFSGLLLLVPTAVLAGWFLHAANALPDRSPERRVEYRVVGYRHGRRRSVVDDVVLESVSAGPAVLRRCVGAGLLGGWPPPNAPIQMKIREGALGWRWISGFDWDSRQHPALTREERRRFRLAGYVCAA